MHKIPPEKSGVFSGRRRRHLIALPAIPRTAMIPVEHAARPAFISFLSRITSSVFMFLAHRKSINK